MKLLSLIGVIIMKRTSAVILSPWGKVGKREDGGDKDDIRDGGDYAQGEGTKRKKGKTKSA